MTESYHSNPHTPSIPGNAMPSPRPDVTHSTGNGNQPPLPTGLNSRGRNAIRRDRDPIHRKDSIKDVLQPSLSDPENPPK